jgi:hypothetical protein
MTRLSSQSRGIFKRYARHNRDQHDDSVARSWGRPGSLNGRGRQARVARREVATSYATGETGRLRPGWESPQPMEPAELRRVPASIRHVGKTAFASSAHAVGRAGDVGRPLFSPIRNGSSRRCSASIPTTPRSTG